MTDPDKQRLILLRRLRCRRQNPVQPQIHRLGAVVIVPVVAQNNQRRHQLVLRVRVRQFRVRRRHPGYLRAKKIVGLRDVHHQVPKRIHLRCWLKVVFLRRHRLRRRHHDLRKPPQLRLHRRRHGIRHRPHVRLSARRPRRLLPTCRRRRQLRLCNFRHQEHCHHRRHRPSDLFHGSFLLALILRLRFTKDSSASSRSSPPFPGTDHPGCPIPSKNSLYSRAVSRSRRSSPNPRARFSPSRPLPFPLRGKCCTPSRTSLRFPCTRTRRRAPPPNSRNPAAHAATRCSLFR